MKFYHPTAGLIIPRLRNGLSTNYHAALRASNRDPLGGGPLLFSLAEKSRQKNQPLRFLRRFKLGPADLKQQMALDGLQLQIS